MIHFLAGELSACAAEASDKVASLGLGHEQLQCEVIIRDLEFGTLARKSLTLVTDDAPRRLVDSVRRALDEALARPARQGRSNG